MKKFTIKEALKFAWNKTKKYWKIMFMIGVVCILISISQNILDYIIQIMFGNDNIVTATILLLLSIIYIFINLLTGYNILKMGFKIINDEKPHIKEIFHYKNEVLRMLKWFLSNIIYGFMVVVIPALALAISYGIGSSNYIIITIMLVSIVPTFYIAMKYWPIKYILVDKNIGLIEAFKQSSRMTKGNLGNILLFNLTAVGIVILGVICLVVGVIPAIMIVYIAQLHVYKKLAA